MGKSESSSSSRYIVDEEEGLIPLPVLAHRTNSVWKNPDVDEPGKVAWIPLENLYIDRAYQRPIMTRGRVNIIHIIENFNWMYFGALMVAKRGPNEYVIIDGQHRAVAAKTHGGIKEVPCLIINVKTQAEEAKAFMTANGKVTAISAQQLYVANTVAEDPVAKRIAAVCQAAGVTISRYPVPADKIKPGVTLAVGAIKVIIDRYGEEVAIISLKTITKTRGGNAGFLNQNTISGTASALHKWPRLFNQETKLLAAIEEVGVPKIFTAARRKQSLDGGSMTSFYAAELTKVLVEAGLLPRNEETMPEGRFVL